MNMEIKDLAGFGEPIKRLIEVIAQGVGTVYQPYLIRRTAKAEAYKIRVLAEARADEVRILAGSAKDSNLLASVTYEDGKVKIEPSSEALKQVPSLPERVEKRQEYQELHNQQNIESICANAAQELLDKTEVAEESPEPEWINHFFDIGKSISTEDLQFIWGKVLAGEIEQPGSFSLRTLEILRNMTRKEAEIFTELCQYALVSADRKVFFLSSPSYVAEDRRIIFENVLLLKDTGLVFPNDLNIQFTSDEDGKAPYLIYGNIIILLEMEKDAQSPSVNVNLLTKAGIELLQLISIEPSMEYIELVAERFSSNGIRVAWGPFVLEDNNLIIQKKTYVEI